MRSNTAQEFRPGDLVQCMVDVQDVPIGTVGRIQRKLRVSDLYKVRFDGYGFHDIEAAYLCGVSREAAQRAGG